MDWMEGVLMLGALGVLIFGFVRNDRRILLAAGLVLFLGGTVGDVVQGFEQGYRDAGR
ncbi:hypothetical protein [Coralloluteibacterium thermophilus]|uniref:Uncharacterized protein n=1 Tax=Coralloluteibacterium thermophilum TaxID=2707049 RepID=A0ABV9NI80_9GAMM